MITQIHPFTALKSASYLNLTTFRRSGEAVATPLWFAEHEGVLYVQTFPTAGKLKRIGHTRRVTVAPCTLNGGALGPEIEAEARIVTDEQEMSLAEAALSLKYGLTRRIYFAAMNIYGRLRRRAPSGRTYIAIEPAVSTHSVLQSRISSPTRSASYSSTSIVPLFLNW